MIASDQLRKLEEYATGVRDGEINVSHITRAAVFRYFRDLERQETEEFPFWFDSQAAENACEFFPCLKHSIGAYAGQPFLLEPWQVFGVANIFGWKRLGDGTRRFRKVYWSTGRKNGKSCFASGLALLMAIGDINPNTGAPESVAQVLLCATMRQQVERTIYKEILRMRKQIPEIFEISTDINRQVTFPETESTIECLGSDKAFDGLNPSCIIKDELHEFRPMHQTFLDTMDTAGGSRDQVLDVMTTTAGARNSWIWRNVYDYARKVAFEDVTDESWFVWCFELDSKDDPLDEENWIKANPNLGISLKWEFLREQAREAGESKVNLNKFTRYHGNRMTDSRERAFDMDKWDACQGELSDWSQADAIGAGIDLGGRDDLASFALCARFPLTDDEEPIWRYELKQWSFIASDCERDVSAEPFASWIYEERLHQTEHPLAALRQELIDHCHELYIPEIAYDPAGAQMLAEEIEEQGFRCGRMGQTCANFNEPIRALLQAINEGRFRHNGDPVLRWAADNAVLITNWKKEVMFSKRESVDKIDPIVAGCMAFRRAMLAPRCPIGPFALLTDPDQPNPDRLTHEQARQQYLESIFDDD